MNDSYTFLYVRIEFSAGADSLPCLISMYKQITPYFTNIPAFTQVSDSGQMKVLDSQVDYGLPALSSGMNGNTPRLVRSNTDEIIDEEFAAAKVNLDDVLDIVEYADETTPAVGKKDDGVFVCCSAF